MDADAEPDAGDTVDLLRRWHRGDRDALDTLLGRELPWIERRVRARLGARLRAKEETGDIVQETVLEFLEYGPPFLVAGRGQLRALLARIAENVLRARHDWFTAKRRALSRERPLPPGSVASLDGSGARPASHPAPRSLPRSPSESLPQSSRRSLPPSHDRDAAPGSVPTGMAGAGVGATPSAEVAAAEEAAIVRLALELLDPADRDVILLREWDGLSHAEVARRLGTSEDAARMRYSRALARLAGWIASVRRGTIERTLAEAAEAAEDMEAEEATG